jgi:hypothetical protein
MLPDELLSFYLSSSLSRPSGRGAPGPVSVYFPGARRLTFYRRCVLDQWALIEADH